MFGQVLADVAPFKAASGHRRGELATEGITDDPGWPSTTGGQPLRYDPRLFRSLKCPPRLVAITETCRVQIRTAIRGRMNSRASGIMERLAVTNPGSMPAVPPPSETSDSSACSRNPASVDQLLETPCGGRIDQQEGAAGITCG